MQPADQTQLLLSLSPPSACRILSTLTNLVGTNRQVSLTRRDLASPDPWAHMSRAIVPRNLCRHFLLAVYQAAEQLLLPRGCRKCLTPDGADSAEVDGPAFPCDPLHQHRGRLGQQDMVS